MLSYRQCGVNSVDNLPNEICPPGNNEVYPDTRKHQILTCSVSDPSADFEVSIFLTETNTRHSLLYKHKHFRDKTQTKLTSNSTKLTGASRGAPIDVEGDEGLCQGSGSPVLRREESDEIDAVILDEIPTIAEVANQPDVALNQQSKRRRDQKQPTVAGDGDDEDADEEADENYNLAGAIRIDSSADDDEHSDSDELFVETRPSKRRKEKETEPEPIAGDDKKKLAMDISYEGFAIYGRVLCLVVKRRESGRTALAVASNKTQTTGGQAMMENWITSTQMPAAEGADEADA